MIKRLRPDTFLLAITSFACLWLMTGQSMSAQIEGSEPLAGQAADEATESGPHDSDSQQTATNDDERDLGERLKSFLRVRYDSQGRAVGMETSVTRYIKQRANGQTAYVDLIGVVHIGERGYYEQLNDIFTSYDAVLYELVAPEGTRIPKGGRINDEFNPISALQNGMKSMLELEFQLDHIDYMQDNLVHADMSPEEFLESMSANDESFIKMFFKSIGQGLAMQRESQTTETDMLMALMAPDRTARLRRLMADQMQNIESGLVIFEGREGSTIINHRNRKAFTILDREIDDGQTKLAVFYGAGHLADMEQLLVRDRGFRRAGQYWLTAWDLQGND